MAIMTTNGSAFRAPSRSASFQKMLELEKKYKLERLQNISRPAPSQRHPPSSSAQYPRQQQAPPPPLPPQTQPQEQQEPHHQHQHQQQHHHHQQQQEHYHQQHQHHHQQEEEQPSPLDEDLPEPQFQQKDERSGSFSQEQNLLMLKAVRRSVALPSLSISIPPPPNASSSKEEQRSKSDDGKAMADVSAGVPSDESAISDDDICQSPTWAGYKQGEKKEKERKKQKKKDKEQASKDAKVAKKRLTARLSKIHPSQPPSKESSPAPTNRKLLKAATEPLSIEYPQDNGGDVHHALAKLTGQAYHPSGKRPPSRGTNSFVGGVKLASQSEETVKRIAEARERAIERDNAAATNPMAVQLKAFSITPGTLPRLGRKTPTAPLPTTTKEKEKGVSRPPITIHSLFRQGRTNSMTQASSNTTNNEDTVPEPNPNHVTPHNRSTPTLLQHASTPHAQEPRGRPGSAGGSGYVRSARAQSSERAISGFKEELKVSGFFHRFRTSTHAPKESQAHPQDAELSPPKMIGARPARSSSPRSAASPLQTTPRIDENSIDDTVTNWPSPGVSSPAESEKSSNLRIPNKRSLTRLSPMKPPGSPSFSFTSNMTSYFEHQPIAGHIIEAPQSISTSPSDPHSPKIPEVVKTPTLISEFNQATRSSGSLSAVGVSSQSSTDSQGESRTSERSSASSYADSHEVSPPVSPATTPDTSRPQSQKGGVSTHAGHATKDIDVLDNDQSLPEAFHAITFDIEPAQDDYKNQNGGCKTFKDSEDNWSRSALPMDIDEGMLTNMSNLDLNYPNGSKSSLRQGPPASTASNRTSSSLEDVQDSMPNEEGNDSHTQDDTTDQRRQSLRGFSTDRKGDISFLPPLKHQSLGPPSKGKAGSKPESRIFPVVTSPQGDRSRSMSPAPSTVSKPETIKSDESELSSGPASYLQAARKSTQAPPPSNALRPIHRGQLRGLNARQTALTASLPDKPMAKMFVECCHCKFFHDMPSRLYECMATPDSIVEDKRLGVSGAITTMVKCPWCTHNMSKECCAGYMALVVLQQRLH